MPDLDHAAYNRQRRAYLKSRGRCTRCGKADYRTQVLGRGECQVCRDKRQVYADATNAKATELYHARKVAGLCPKCGGKRDRETLTCSVCLALQRENDRRCRRR